MPKAIATITTNAPKSGSSSSRPPTHDHHREHRQEAADERLLQRLLGVQERRAAHGVARRVQHDGELHELGRLQVDDDERQPAARAVDRLADAGHQHQHQQHGAGDEQPGRQLAATRFTGTWNATAAATRPTATNMRVPHQEIPRAVAGVRRRLGHRDRRRIHHHQAEREQQQRRPRERRVVGAASRARRAPPRRRRTASAACRSDAVSVRRLRMRAAPSARVHERGEALAALDVVAEQVEARARRRQQHGVARLARARSRASTAASSVPHDLDVRARALERARDQRRVAADQQHGAAIGVDRRA